MEQDKYITQFSTYLFWDVKREDLDMEKHSRYCLLYTSDAADE